MFQPLIILFKLSFRYAISFITKQTITTFITIILLTNAFVLTSCKDEHNVTSLPEIKFNISSGFVYNDTSLTLGSAINVGITASCIDANITNFTVKMDNGATQHFLDSGMNVSSLTYNTTIIKSNSPIERWTFTAMNRNRLSASVTLVLTKVNTLVYGSIDSVSHILLGAQNNMSIGSFYSISSNSVYTLDSAFAHQGLIDIIYYYGTYLSTLSSPNETEAPGHFTGPSGIANWTIKNESRYDTTLLSIAAFDAAVNDSLILISYDQIAGKKKAKFLAPGQIISFINAEGKIGLLKINSVNGTDAGTLDISIKIQH